MTGCSGFPSGAAAEEMAQSWQEPRSEVIVFLSTADTDLLTLRRALEISARAPEGPLPEVWAGNPALPGAVERASQALESATPGAGTVVLRLHGGTAGIVPAVDGLVALCRRRELPLIVLAGDGRPDARLAALNTAPAEVVARVARYVEYGGVANFVSLLRDIAARLLEAASRGLWQEPTPATLRNLRQEGELRPQLLDRFGLAADVTTPRDALDRTAVVRRRIAFDADPLQFTDVWADADRRLGAEITAARDRLPAVQIDDALLDLIARICIAYEVDGLRADIVIYKASAALAALDGRLRATAADVRCAAELALPHRRRRDPFDESGFDPGPLDRLTGDHTSAGVPANAGVREEDSAAGAASKGEQSAAAPPTTGSSLAEPPPTQEVEAPGPPGTSAQHGATATSGEPKQGAAAQHGGTEEPPDEPISPLLPPGALPEPAPTGASPRASRRAQRAGRGTPGAPRGHGVGSAVPHGRPSSLALGATLRAAAPHQRHRRPLPLPAGGPWGGSAVPAPDGPWERSLGPAPRGPAAVEAATPVALRLLPADLRERVHEAHQGRLLLFVVDASGSMAGQRRLALAKGAVHALLLDAYRRRDTVGLIAFRGAHARLVLPPTNSVFLADRRLVDLAAGGRTPLAAGLHLAGETIQRYAHGAAPVVVLVTDGKANVARQGHDPWTSALRAAGHLRHQRVAAAVVDADWGSVHLGLSQALADALGGAVLRLLPPPDAADPIPAASLASAVQRLIAPTGATRGARWV